MTVTNRSNPPARVFRGTTTIAEPVVAKLAAGAARDIDGVVSLGGSLAGALSGVVGRIRGDGEDHRTAGVGVEVGDRKVAIDLSVALRYPTPVAALTEDVRTRVAARVEALTGMEVVEVNIDVSDLVIDPPEASERVVA